MSEVFLAKFKSCAKRTPQFCILNSEFIIIIYTEGEKINENLNRL